MRPETYTTLNVTDPVSSSGNSHLMHGYELHAEGSLNYEDVLLPYPSPPAESRLEPTILKSLKPSSDPASTISTDTADSENVVVSVSTSFNPTSHSVKPDLIFNTSDMVLFYVHSQILRGLPSEPFGRILLSQNQNGTSQASQGMAGDGVIYDISDTSTIFNVVLHTLYGTSPAPNLPSFETLITAVDRMLFYSINPKDFITRQTPLYQLLLTHAPLFPLQVYALAGHHGLEDLAVASSSHLLSFPMSNIPDEMATRMGSTYLKRLFCLHFNRIDALKQILLAPPPPHPPTKECGFSEQKPLTRAWILVAAYLAWDARPDSSTSSMRKAFRPLTESLTCELCQSGLEKRVKEIVDQWASVKPTI